MEHPLVNNLDSLTAEQLNTQITDLNQKLIIAMRSGNAHLCNQIRMALESYQNKYQQKMQEAYSKQFDRSITDRIQIK